MELLSFLYLPRVGSAAFSRSAKRYLPFWAPSEGSRTTARLSKSLPKYRKHRASGQAVVTLAGVDHYLGPHGTKASKVEYDRLIGEWLAGGHNSLVASPQEITVVELCARYWKFARGYYRKNGQPTGTTDTIKQAVRFLKDWYGKTVASEFGPLALKAVRGRMVDAGLSRTYLAVIDLEPIENASRNDSRVSGTMPTPTGARSSALATRGTSSGGARIGCGIWRPQKSVANLAWKRPK